jgi:hypothetical protein
VALPAVLGAIGRGMAAGVAADVAAIGKAFADVGAHAKAGTLDVGKLGAALGAVKQSGGNLAALVTKPLEAVGAAVAAPIKLVAGALNAIQAPVLAVVGALNQFRSAVTALGEAVSGFVALANPAYVKQFQFAADDLTASIGRALIPVLQFATRMTRAFADVVFTLSAPFARLASAVLKPLGDRLEAIANVAGPFAAAVGAMIDVMAAVLKPIHTLLTALTKIALFPAEATFSLIAKAVEYLTVPTLVLARILGDLADRFSAFVDRALGAARRLLGITPTSGVSVGAAVRNVQIGSVEGFQNQALKAAFSMGAGSSPAERTNTLIDELYNFLKTLPGLMWEKIKQLPDLMWGLLKGLPADLAALLRDMLPGSKTAGEAADTVSDVWKRGLDAGRKLKDNVGGRIERGLDRLNPFTP